MSSTKNGKETIANFEQTIRRVRQENRDHVEVWLARLSRANLKERVASWRLRQESPPSVEDLRKTLLCEDIPA